MMMALPRKDRYDHVARLVAAHGSGVEEVCAKISPEMFINVGTMLTVVDDHALTYALGPKWKISHLGPRA